MAKIPRKKYNYEDYQEILKLLEKLITNKSMTSSDEYAQIHTKVTNYFVTHFDEEQEFMEKFNSPGVEQHISKHNQFLKKLALLDSNSKLKVSTKRERLCYEISDWLINHELNADITYLEDITNRLIECK